MIEVDLMPIERGLYAVASAIESLARAVAGVSESICSIEPDEDDLVKAVSGIARQIKNLGNADASTPMGGLEALGAVLKEGLEGLAIAVERESG